MNSVCRRPSVGSKSAPISSVKSVSSVREKTPQRVVCVLSHTSGCVLFLTENTEEQNTQHSTETLSQPISQNLTAIFSRNALWPLYAGGLLWARNSAPKNSVNSVCSVREKTPLREIKYSAAFYLCVVLLRGKHIMWVFLTCCPMNWRTFINTYNQLVM